MIRDGWSNNFSSNGTTIHPTWISWSHLGILSCLLWGLCPTRRGRCFKSPRERRAGLSKAKCSRRTRAWSIPMTWQWLMNQGECTPQGWTSFHFIWKPNHSLWRILTSLAKALVITIARNSHQREHCDELVRSLLCLIFTKTWWR